MQEFKVLLLKKIFETEKKREGKEETRQIDKEVTYM